MNQLHLSHMPNQKVSASKNKKIMYNMEILTPVTDTASDFRDFKWMLESYPIYLIVSSIISPLTAGPSLLASGAGCRGCKERWIDSVIVPGPIALGFGFQMAQKARSKKRLLWETAPHTPAITTMHTHTKGIVTCASNISFPITGFISVSACSVLSFLGSWEDSDFP